MGNGIPISQSSAPRPRPILFSLEVYLSKKRLNRRPVPLRTSLGGLAPSAGGHIVKAEVVWVAVTRLGLVVRALELVLLTAPTRLILQLFPGLFFSSSRS